MVFSTEFIDFKTQHLQYFSVPKTLFYYIFEHSQVSVFHQLLRSCKYIKLMQLKKNKSKIDKLNIAASILMFDFGPYSKVHDSNKTSIVIKAKEIAVQNILVLEYAPENLFNDLIPRFDLSRTSKIDLHLDFEIKMDVMEKILNPSITFLKLKLLKCNDGNLPLMAFQKCPKMSVMIISTLSLVTESIFTEMLSTKRNMKILLFNISPIEKIDLDVFVPFIDRHLTSSAWISLEFNHRQTFEQMREDIRQLSKKQQNPNRRISLQFGEAFSARI